MRRLFTPVDKRFGLALHIRRIERFWAENNGGHAVEDGVHAALQRLLMRGFAAGYRAADRFAQRRQRVAFMFGKGQQRPSGEVCITAGSVVGTPRASISDPAGTGTPLCRATRVLPKAMALVA